MSVLQETSVSCSRMNAKQRLGRDFIHDAQCRVVGEDCAVPILGGMRHRYVNLDNAATTPPLTGVSECVQEFLEWYGSVHRGTGAKSVVSTRCYVRAREIVGEWVGADPDRHVIIFTRSTTDSINKVARKLSSQGRLRVLCTVMEHHSNLLPWRTNCDVDMVDVREEDGSLDLQQLEDKLKSAGGKVELVAVTGASNVTGLTPPIYQIARMAHEHGAEILVDGAQLVAHRAVNMGSADDPERIDYLAFSAHKAYAPFGTGVLVAPRDLFRSGLPDMVGGGAVKLVGLEDVLWADTPERDEAGSPNAVGVVALAKAIQILSSIGMDRVTEHDLDLRALTVDVLKQLPGVRLFGEPCARDHGHVGVVSFVVENMHHSLVAAVLGHEWGIGVRHGCFCAHPYILRLLGIDPLQFGEYKMQAMNSDHSGFPGLVRISVGLYNTPGDIAYLAGALKSLLQNGPEGHYVMHAPSGEYIPENGYCAEKSSFQL